MSIAFRNVDVPAGAPPGEWPYEAIVTVIERGSICDWATLTREVRTDPWGQVARQLEDYFTYSRPPGVCALIERAIASARAAAEASERAEVAREVDDLVRRSTLASGVFAKRIGTSASRLSTYRTGKVTPSASLLVRMRRVAGRLSGERTGG